MKFKVDHRLPPTVARYPTESMELSRKFARRMYEEFGTFLKALVVFGEAAKRTGKEHDIDILIVVDDVSVILSPELIQTYRLLTEKIIAEVTTRMHVMSLKLSSFWEYVRAGDPVMINILRDGVALIDYGFFDPLQLLLRQGRIRPSDEAVWNYMVRAPGTLHNSQWHILQATLDLYWAVIDAAHSALMFHGALPPSPAEAGHLIREKMVKPGIVKAKYADQMDFFYKLHKKIVHRELKNVNGQEYEKYRKQAEDFVGVMKGLVEKGLKAKLW